MHFIRFSDGSLLFNEFLHQKWLTHIQTCIHVNNVIQMSKRECGIFRTNLEEI